MGPGSSRVPLAGGTPQPVTTGSNPHVTPDGRHLAFERPCDDTTEPVPDLPESDYDAAGCLRRGVRPRSRNRRRDARRDRIGRGTAPASALSGRRQCARRMVRLDRRRVPRTDRAHRCRAAARAPMSTSCWSRPLSTAPTSSACTTTNRTALPRALPSGRTRRSRNLPSCTWSDRFPAATEETVVNRLASGTSANAALLIEGTYPQLGRGICDRRPRARRAPDTPVAHRDAVGGTDPDDRTFGLTRGPAASATCATS